MSLNKRVLEKYWALLKERLTHEQLNDVKDAVGFIDGDELTTDTLIGLIKTADAVLRE